MGMLPDIPLPFPAYSGVIPPEAATLPAILREEGWVTWAIGKWHLTPRDHRGPAGPFHTWPTGQGFDRYYGFIGGEDSQWTPDMIRDQSYVERPKRPSEGYHFTEDIADEAIRNIRELRLHQPDRPFMMYWATGAPHSPHQVPREWIDAYAGRFDDGWDVLRERTLARQKELGIVPPDVELSERPSWIDAWDDLPEEEQQLYARLQEVFAGFLTHADAQIGRIVDELDRSGELDNTIIMVISDNGASGEGGPHGSVNHLGQLNNHLEDLDRLKAEADRAGGHHGYNHYPWGWAHAGNTPLKRWKRYAFEGGVRDPLIVRWPTRTVDPGGLRDQYCHAIDLLPTVLDLLDVEMPDEVRGVEQMSLDGVSLGPTIDDVAADEVRTSQYYEVWGSRAMYHEGWKVVTDHVNQLNPYERERMEGSDDFRTDHWALFHTDEDFAETEDLAAVHPDKRDELVALWWEEADRNHVLPLDDAVQNRFPFMHTPYLGFRRRYELRAGERISVYSGPMMGGGFTAAASLTAPLGNHQGTICEQGDWIAGWSWVVQDGELVFHLHAPDSGGHRFALPAPTDARVLGLVITDSSGGGFELSMSGDGAEIGRGEVAGRVPDIITTNGEWLTVGYSTDFPVAEDYDPPFPLVVLGEVVIDAGPPKLPEFDVLMSEMMRHQ